LPRENIAHFRFYAELNDFLSPERRMRRFAHPFVDAMPVKEMIEGFGVPHTEVDLILANGEPVDFSYVVRNGDWLSVYPMFEALDIAPLARLRPEPLREPRFVLDAHLGRLAGYLRMLGFDALYQNHAGDAELARVSRDERRILLTRDRGLLKRRAVTHGYFVRETAVRRQTSEVVSRFDLRRLIRPFTRCLRCNEPLEPASSEQALKRLPPRAAELYREFQACASCGRLYRKGGHYRRMQQFIESGL
jgi:uncharacterized protein with PIN domain